MRKRSFICLFMYKVFSLHTQCHVTKYKSSMDKIYATIAGDSKYRIGTALFTRQAIKQSNETHDYRNK